MPTIDFPATKTQSAFIISRSYINFLMGPRGEGKTTSGLFGALAHALEQNPVHWPIRWAVIRDTWENLRITTIDTIRRAVKKYGIPNEGLDKLEPRIVKIGMRTTAGSFRPLVEFNFFGLDQPEDANRLQGFEGAGAWIEEPAPAADISSGIPEDCMLVVTSLRQGGTEGVTPRVQITMNPPDKDHWTMKYRDDQDVVDALRRRGMTVAFFEIPPGENPGVTVEYREANRAILEAMGRFDLIARLVEGQVGYVQMGVAVTPEFGQVHIAKSSLPILRTVPVIRSYDFGLCYDDQTEILTKAGWKLFRDINPREAVATRDPLTGTFEYQAPESLIVRPYRGQMLRYETDNVDFCVTPEHLIPVWKERGHNRIPEFQKLPAATVAIRSNLHVSVDLLSRWAGEDPITVGPLGWSAQLFARFMGWYLSEGSTYKRRVVIYQTREHALLSRVLRETGLPWRRQTVRGQQVGWWVTDAKLANYLKDCGRDATVKHVPDEIKSMTPGTVWSFLESFIAGDGHLRQRPNRCWEYSAFTSSKQLADDLQELSQKAGFYARITWRQPCTRTISDSGGGSHEAYSQGGFVLSFKMKAVRAGLYKRYFSERQYSGMIYCVTVPNGVVYVRRNGIAHWNGNSPTTTFWQVTPIGRINVFYSVRSEHMGMEQHIAQQVLPWLGRKGIRDYHFEDDGDPNGLTPEARNSNVSAVSAIEEMLTSSPKVPASFTPGPISIQDRVGPIRFKLRSMLKGGQPVVQIDPEATAMNRTLSGGWHRKKTPAGLVGDPVKDQFSEHGDSWGYGMGIRFPIPDLIERPKSKSRGHELVGLGQDRSWMTS